MPTFNFTDNIHSLTSNASLDMGDSLAQNYITAVNSLNAVAPISSVALASGVGTITLKDLRTFSVTVQVGSPPTFKPVAGSFFTQSEFPLLQSVLQVVNEMMLTAGLTTLTDTFA